MSNSFNTIYPVLGVGDNVITLADIGVYATPQLDISITDFLGYDFTGNTGGVNRSISKYVGSRGVYSPGPANGFNITCTSTNDNGSPASITVTVPSSFPVDAGTGVISVKCILWPDDFLGRAWQFYLYFKVTTNDVGSGSSSGPEAPVVFNIDDTSASFSCPYPLVSPFVTYQPQLYDPVAGIWVSCGPDCTGGEVVTAIGLTPNTSGYKVQFIGVPDPALNEDNVDGADSSSFTTLAAAVPTVCSAYPLGKDVSSDYLSMLNHTPTTRALLIKITRADGAVFAYTTASSDIDGSDVLADGSTIAELDGVVFKSKGGMTPTGVSNSVNLNRSDNLDVGALITDDGIDNADLASGLFDGAEMVICEVNYLDLTQGIMRHKKGYLGQMTFDESRFKGTFNSLAQKLTAPILELGSVTCRAKEFGDFRCKVGTTIDIPDRYVVADAGTTVNNGVYTRTGTYNNKPYFVNTNLKYLFYTGTQWWFNDVLGGSSASYQVTSSSSTPPLSGWSVGDNDSPAPTLTHQAPTATTQTVDGYDITITGSVAAVDETEPARIVTLDSIGSIPDGYYNYGKLTITQADSPNYNYTRKIRSHAASVIELAEPFPSNVTVGDAFSIMMGCDRRAETCSQRYNNKVNFRGEDHTPGVNIYAVTDS